MQLCPPPPPPPPIRCIPPQELLVLTLWRTNTASILHPCGWLWYIYCYLDVAIQQTKIDHNCSHRNSELAGHWKSFGLNMVSQAWHAVTCGLLCVNVRLDIGIFATIPTWGYEYETNSTEKKTAYPLVFDFCMQDTDTRSLPVSFCSLFLASGSSQ